MSADQIVRYRLRCDGCGLQAEGEHASATEARAAAYGAGWRFPSRVNASGGASSRTSDVCPRCVPTWQPKGATKRTRSATGGTG